MNKHDYSFEEYGDITPFENYVASFRDKTTRKKHDGQLEMFLNPDYKWDTPQQTRFHATESKFAVMVNDFAALIRNDPNAGKNRIKRYVMKLKNQVEQKKLNPNTAKNMVHCESIMSMLSYQYTIFYSLK